MSKLFPLARMTSATTGTGTLTLGAAVSGYLTFALAGVTDGTWVTYGIKDGANSEVGYGKYTAAGTTLTRNPQFSTNSNALISCSGGQEVYVTAAPADYDFPDSYLSGLTLSNDGVSPNTVLDIAAGCAADNSNTDIMRLASAITKTTGAWAVGSGNGGLDTGAVAASTWYHVYLIRRQDTGVTDVLFSTSATTPTMPTNYTQLRRIGSFKTDGSSNILAFFQNGNEFLWASAPGDINTTNPGTAAILANLSIPPGIRTKALLNVLIINNTPVGAEFYFSSPDTTDLGSGEVAAPYGNAGNNTTVVMRFGSQISVWSNTSQQIRYRAAASDAGLTIKVSTAGWVDNRGAPTSSPAPVIVSPVVPNYLTGLTLSNDGGSPNTVLDIAAGTAADSTNAAMMALAAAITKTTGAWAVGTGNGGLDTGSIAINTWYHVYLIRRPDTGVVDVLFSTSASAPTMPTNYTQFRRIGSFKTATGTTNIVAFTQRGGEFLWSVPTQDFTSSTLPASATLVTANVPIGVQVGALIFGYTTATGALDFLFTSPDQTDTAPTATLTYGRPASVNTPFMLSVRTNTSAQVRFRPDVTNTQLVLNTNGWIDARGML